MVALIHWSVEVVGDELNQIFHAETTLFGRNRVGTQGVAGLVRNNIKKRLAVAHHRQDLTGLHPRRKFGKSGFDIAERDDRHGGIMPASRRDRQASELPHHPTTRHSGLRAGA